MLFEYKHHTADLGKEHASQLYRYFSVTEAQFSVLTNGILYWFYTDLDARNKMDVKPFFEFNMLDIRDQDVEELKKFTKSTFDLNGILTTASELKYTRDIKRIMAEQLQEPSEDFVKFFAAQVYAGRMTQAIREQFTHTTKHALKQFINDQISERLKTALAAEEVIPKPTDTAAGPNGVQEQDGIVTTQEETEAVDVIKAILREVVDASRIKIRDVQSYCGILLDDNNRKPICRLWFDTAQHYIGLFDKDQKKAERVPIAGIDEIYHYADRLKATVGHYVQERSH